eukprot:TsM_000647300 transcript=TsM_000647300 gene=TsM_000647300
MLQVLNLESQRDAVACLKNWKMTSLRTEKNVDDGTALEIEYNTIAQYCRKTEREKKRMVEHFRVSFCKFDEKLANKIRLFSAKCEKDNDTFDIETKECQRLNDYLGRLHVFINTKSKRRYKHLIMPERDQAASDKLETYHLEDLEEAFNKLGDLLGVTNFEKIVEIFKSKEAQIKRAFEYVNVQDSDCSKTKEQIDQLEEKKVQTLDELKASANRFRDQILRLDGKYTSIKAETVALARSLRRARKMAKHILQEVKIFKSIVHCDTDSEADLDFSALGRVAKTMMALEQRIGQIYDLYKAMKNKSGGSMATKEVPDTPTYLQSDSAISEDDATTDGIDKLPETFDEISVDSGNISQPICEVQLRKLML